MKIKVTDIVRWVLTVGLLIGIFTETGVFTTIFLTLMAIGAELSSFHFRGLAERVL